MKRKSFICGFIIVLLVSPASILAENLEEVKESRSKRQAQVLLPIASYAGMTVSAPLFAALVAAYGIYAVTKYAISKGIILTDIFKKHVSTISIFNTRSLIYICII